MPFVEFEAFLVQLRLLLPQAARQHVQLSDLEDLSESALVVGGVVKDVVSEAEGQHEVRGADNQQ